jgi:predicted RNA binding protein YcfA (HicA-like mRNA interferase family)
MTQWRSTKGRQVLAALQRLGWRVKRQTGSHKVLERDGYPNYIFSFGDSDEIGSKMLTKIAKATGLTPDDLQ